MPPVKKKKRNRSPHFLREWRDYRGISQEEACERLDISTSTLSRIENGILPYNQDFMEAELTDTLWSWEEMDSWEEMATKMGAATALTLQRIPNNRRIND